MKSANGIQWERTWTAQECVLAPSATVMYGGMTAPWNMFAGAAKVHKRNTAWVDVSPPGFSTLRVSADPLDNLSRLILQIEAPRSLLNAGKPLCPLQALQQFHVRHATDPRDKVFGLLGLMDDAIIDPDYRMSTLDVFLNTAMGIILSTRRLDILKGARLSNTPGLPTWCTDWGTTQDHAEWQRIRCLGLYNACAGARGFIDFHRSVNDAGPARILEVQGLVLDTVESVLPGAGPEQGTARWKVVHRQWADGVAEEVSSSDSFWMSLCGGLLYVAGEDGFRLATSADRKHYVSWTTDDSAKMNRKTRFMEIGNEAVVVSRTSIHRNEFFHAMQTMTTGRRMFTTRDGRLGIGPGSTTPGDEVAVLAGSSVPLLLRREKTMAFWAGTHNNKSTGEKAIAHASCFTVVGDIYVPGIMEGEAVVSMLGLMATIYLI